MPVPSNSFQLTTMFTPVFRRSTSTASSRGTSTSVSSSRTSFSGLGTSTRPAGPSPGAGGRPSRTATTAASTTRRVRVNLTNMGVAWKAPHERGPRLLFRELAQHPVPKRAHYRRQLGVRELLQELHEVRGAEKR